PVLDWLDQAEIVLLGEGSHGTQEFYTLRAALTRRLIAERGFGGVAIEGDWPDALRVNRYVRQRGSGARTGGEALAGFERFPQWMWRNAPTLEFVEWLHDHNAALPARDRAGVYGLDLYSLRASMQAVVEFLRRVDPPAAEAARRSYACFDRFDGGTEAYGWAMSRLDDGTCEEAVVRELVALRERQQEILRREGGDLVDEFFSAEQNARLARNAERYYRTMFLGRVASWNVRDHHMAETLDELLDHLKRTGRPPKLVVWAHNSHVGDARATELGEDGEVTLGQLVRERHEGRARSIGFTTHQGTVLAAADWGEPGHVQVVRPALDGSYERLFHASGVPRFFLPLDHVNPATRVLDAVRLQRAIGVVYLPATERWSHYFHANLPRQFDGVIHVDETSALTPLDQSSPRPLVEAPETFPSGL
ncbi:MAG TPA: erythromycin esterase family protein, partial [Candidatus Synoicihabitans sp.]|nr:erythromycin esterase family protein [Candidatus Synoicihabitans sp.]